MNQPEHSRGSSRHRQHLRWAWKRKMQSQSFVTVFSCSKKKKKTTTTTDRVKQTTLHCCDVGVAALRNHS